MPEENQTLETPFGEAFITLTPRKLIINYKPTLGQIFEKPIGLGNDFSVDQKFKVITVDRNSFTIQRYGALTDKKLTLEAELITVVPDVKQVKSTVDVEIVQ